MNNLSLILALNLLASGLPLVAQGEADEKLIVDRERDAFEIAEQLFAQSQNDHLDAEVKRSLQHQAGKLFYDFAQNFPKSDHSPRALYIAASCFDVVGESDRAYRIYQDLSRRDLGEYTAAAAYQLGIRSLTKEHYKMADHYFQLVLKSSEKPHLIQDVQYRLARIARARGEDNTAESFYQKLLLQDDLVPSLLGACLYDLAQLKLKRQQDAEAYSYFVRLLTIKEIAADTRASATLQAARLASKLGKSDRSQEYYSKLSQLEGMEDFRHEAQMEQILDLLKQKSYNNIINIHTRSNIQLKDPEKMATYSLIIGQAYMELKMYEEATSWFERVQKLRPNTKVGLEAAYREIACAQARKSSNLFILAEKYLKKYPSLADTADHPLNDMVRLIYADRLLRVDMEKAGRQYEVINIMNLPVEIRPDVLFRKAWLGAKLDTIDPTPILNNFLENYQGHKKVPEALALRGEMLAKRGNVEEGIEDLKRVIHAFPKSQAAALSWQRTAQLYKELKRDDQMIYYYEGLLKNFPFIKGAARAEAYFSIASACLEKNPAKAIEQFKLARQVNVKKYAPLADLNLVQIYYKLQQLPELIASLTDLQKTNKKGYDQLPASLFRWLGWTCYQNKDYQKANRYLTLSLERELTETYTGPKGEKLKRPKVEPLIWKTLARARLELRRYDQALIAAEHYVSMESQPYRKAEGLRDLALILIGLNRQAEAITMAEDAIALGVDGPIKSSLFITLGDAYYSQKEYLEAAKYYGRTANIASDQQLKPLALFKITWALYNSKRMQEAAQYEKMLKRDFPLWEPSGELSLFMKHES